MTSTEGKSSLLLVGSCTHFIESLLQVKEGNFELNYANICIGVICIDYAD
jgi:hypothetical protein